MFMEKHELIFNFMAATCLMGEAKGFKGKWH